MGEEPVQLSRRGSLHLCAGAAALTLVPLAERARSQTARTIKLIVPSAPGGVTDSLARLLGDQIGRTQGATVVIDN
ncbi:MAG TPA: tripartite tricarboxylate transporter substrate binding protein, partial [Xanthobacteraceae bacterium]|nr:tripartite tricarboxylate transporter substrate binding protein [Xanthobacteraceae bacterium]